MAGKLTIRRIGTIIPTLCLLGGVLTVSVIIWLCTAGLPGCALRYIEEEAARAGVNLHINKIRLSPRSGLALKAEKITLLLEQPDAAPLELKVRKVQVGLSLGRMVTGDFTPVNIRVTDGHLKLPLSNEANDEVQLKLEDIYTVFRPDNRGLSTTANARLCNVNVLLRLMLNNAEKSFASLESETQQETDTQLLTAPIVEWRPRIRQVKQILDNQKWNTQQCPILEIAIFQRQNWNARLSASIPCFEIEHFHFRDAELLATIENNNFTVDNLKFRTENPDTTVNLQGGYDWEGRELDFRTKSTAPLVKMLNSYLGEESPRMLSKIQSEQDTTPTIELTGNASFAEDYALNNFSLRGKVEHRSIRMGKVPVDYAHLTFFVRNGEFNVDNFKLELPDGHIIAAAQATSGAGAAELDLSLPDETILALAHEVSGDDTLALPEGLDFSSNVDIRAKVKLLLPDFVPGKSHIEDLIPVLNECDFQFNTGDISYTGSTLTQPSLTLHVDGIDYAGNNIAARNLTLDAMVSKAAVSEEAAGASDLVLNLHFKELSIDKQWENLSLQNGDMRISANAAQMAEGALSKLHATTQLANIKLNTADITGTLCSNAIEAKIQAESLTYRDTQAQAIYLKADIPNGLNVADSWNNMQKDACVLLEINKLSDTSGFCAIDNKLSLHHIGTDKATLDFLSTIGEETATLHATAALQPNDILHLEDIKLHFPAAALTDLLGGEPINELKLPKLVEAAGNASICTATGRIIHSNYQLHLPELVRVCNNVHVHKGMEIPLSINIYGDFSTAENGAMRYNADLTARHAQGELKVHLSGDPLSECHITGTNTIPVNIVNALIDNTDAHWIMRDFRCTPGITQNIITDIDTTIRYDEGIYVYVTCKAELINMDFLLGAIRDKEDATGEPTGEEYLRTDLGTDPYSRIKHGTCDVEVLVQMDCVDAAGKPLPESIRINLLNPVLTYDNRPWLKRMGWETGAATSRITGEAVRFNIDNSTISLHKLRGTCYPAYSIGMYYAPIQHFLEDVILTKPADIATDYCIFPLSRNCQVPMQGLIQAKAASGAGYRFLGTTIPFTNFSGFINISDIDVYLDRMNAKCWGGKIDGALRIGFAGEHTTLDGFFAARNLNLQDIVASYGEEFTPATCNGYIRFQAAEPELDAVRAYGQVHLKDGNLMQMGLFRPIGAFLSDVPGNLNKLQETVHIKKEDAPPSWADRIIRSIFDSGSSALDSVQKSAYNVPFANHFLRYGIDEAFARFDITNGHLITRGMKAKGYNLNVGVELDINLDKLTIQGDLWPKISSVPTAIISPITILSDFLIDINVYGDLLSPEWEFGLSKKIKGAGSSVTSEPQKNESVQSE